MTDKLEARIKREMRKRAEAEEDEDRKAVEEKVEQKLRNIIRDWAET